MGKGRREKKGNNCATKGCATGLKSARGERERLISQEVYFCEKKEVCHRIKAPSGGQKNRTQLLLNGTHRLDAGGKKAVTNF